MDYKKILEIIESELKKKNRVLIDTNSINKIAGNLNLSRYHMDRIKYIIIEKYLNNKEYNIIMLSRSKYLIEKKN
ncbi:MAG: hypothetical protein QW038_02010 [Nanopusillaceae archaeon]